MKTTYVFRFYDRKGYSSRNELLSQHECEATIQDLLDDNFKPCKIEKDSYWKVNSDQQIIVAIEKQAYLKELEEIEQNKVEINWED